MLMILLSLWALKRPTIQCSGHEVLIYLELYDRIATIHFFKCGSFPHFVPQSSLHLIVESPRWSRRNVREGSQVGVWPTHIPGPGKSALGQGNNISRSNVFHPLREYACYCKLTICLPLITIYFGMACTIFMSYHTSKQSCKVNDLGAIPPKREFSR